MERQERTVDSVSRAFAFFAMLAAGVGCAVLYHQNQQLSDRLEKQSAAFYQKWNEQLNSEVKEFHDATQQLASTETENVQQRQQDFDAALERLTQHDLDPLIKSHLALFKQQTLAARLTDVQQVLRPSGEKQTPRDGRLIRNAGPSDAEIRMITFQPDLEAPPFQYTTTDESSADANDAVVLRFVENDNQALDPTKHDSYQRDFLAGTTFIPAFSTTRLVVEIVNDKHVGKDGGYGLTGALTVQYDDGQLITLPGVRARFVADSEI